MLDQVRDTDWPAIDNDSNLQQNLSLANTTSSKSGEVICLTQEKLDMLGNSTLMLGNSTLKFKVDPNCLTGFEDYEFPSKVLVSERTVLVTIYVLLATVALTMNVFIIAVIIRNELHKKVLYVFILVLAISDIIMLTFNMPVGLYYMTMNDWIFGKILCHILFPIFALPFYVSSWTIMLISLERYRATCPKKQISMSRCQAGLMVAAVLCVSVMLAIPIIMYTKFERPRDHLPIFIKDDRALCMERWPEGTKKIRAFYGITIMCTLFILPVTVTIILHHKIYKALSERQKIAQKSVKSLTVTKYTAGESAAEVRTRKTHRRNQSIGKILFSIVVVFVICWSPVNIYLMILDIKPRIVPAKKVVLINCVLKILAMSSSCINPIFYGWLNRAFREEALKLINTCGGPQCIQRRLKKGLLRNNGTDYDMDTAPKTTEFSASSRTARTLENLKNSAIEKNTDVGTTSTLCPQKLSLSSSKQTNETDSCDRQRMLSSEDIDTDTRDYRSWDDCSLGPALTSSGSICSLSDNSNNNVYCIDQPKTLLQPLLTTDQESENSKSHSSKHASYQQ